MADTYTNRLYDALSGYDTEQTRNTEFEQALRNRVLGKDTPQSDWSYPLRNVDNLRTPDAWESNIAPLRAVGGWLADQFSTPEGEILASVVPTGRPLLAGNWKSTGRPNRTRTDFHERVGGTISDYIAKREMLGRPGQRPFTLEDIVDELNRNPATAGREKTKAWDGERLREYIRKGRDAGIIGTAGAVLSSTDEANAMYNPYATNPNTRIDSIAGPFIRGNKRHRFMSEDDSGGAVNALLDGSYEPEPPVQHENALIRMAQGGESRDQFMARMQEQVEFTRQLQDVFREPPSPQATARAQQLMDIAKDRGYATDNIMRGLDAVSRRHGVRPFW